MITPKTSEEKQIESNGDVKNNIIENEADNKEEKAKREVRDEERKILLWIITPLFIIAIVFVVFINV